MSLESIERLYHARINMEKGDTVIWDLGRGVEGVMNALWSCVVNASQEGAAGF